MSAASNGGLQDKPAAIRVEHAVKRYGDFEAVKDVSFSVAEGEIFGLLGPNGAGKSTLIRMMTTLIPLTGGKAFVAGHDVAKDPDDVRRVIGVILTGLGKDGAEGLLELRKAGARTLGQDEATSLIYGMPRVAFERGAVERQFPLTELAGAIVERCSARPAMGARV